MQRRKFLSLFVPAVGLAGCGGRPVPPFRIATFTWPGYEPLFLARRLGYFGEHPIQLLEFPSAAECILAFQNRVVDAITITLDEIIRLAAAGHQPRVVLLMDFSHGADVIVAKPTMKQLADIKGCTVGVESNTLGSFVLARALETKGLTLNDVKTVSHRVDRLEKEFAVGQLDAVVTYEPYRTRLLSAGARQIFDSSQMPGEIADALVVRQSVLDQAPAALRALPSAWFRALDYLKANQLEAARIMAPRENVSPEEFIDALRNVQLLGAAENRKLLASAASSLPITLQRVADFMVRMELVPGPVGTGDILDGRLLADAR